MNPCFALLKAAKLVGITTAVISHTHNLLQRVVLYMSKIMLSSRSIPHLNIISNSLYQQVSDGVTLRLLHVPASQQASGYTVNNKHNRNSSKDISPRGLLLQYDTLPSGQCVRWVVNTNHPPSTQGVAAGPVVVQITAVLLLRLHFPGSPPTRCTTLTRPPPPRLSVPHSSFRTPSRPLSSSTKMWANA